MQAAIMRALTMGNGGDNIRTTERTENDGGPVMKTWFAATGALALCCAGATGAAAQHVRNFQCMATAVIQAAPGVTAQVTMYVSQLIPMDASQHQALNGAWAKYVKETYHLESTAGVHCTPFAASAAMQEQVMAAQESAWARQGWQVVHVNWRPGQGGSSSGSAASIYGAAGAAPAAPATKKTADSTNEPEPRASYCYSDDKKATIYFSDAFDTAGLPSSKAWSTAFSKMLAEKYNYKGIVTCKDSGTILSVNHLILEQKEALQGKQVVETNWTFDASNVPAATIPRSR
jgi:hypothetical protein